MCLSKKLPLEVLESQLFEFSVKFWDDIEKCFSFIDTWSITSSEFSKGFVDFSFGVSIFLSDCPSFRLFDLFNFFFDVFSVTTSWVLATREVSDLDFDILTDDRWKNRRLIDGELGSLLGWCFDIFSLPLQFGISVVSMLWLRSFFFELL